MIRRAMRVLALALILGSVACCASALTPAETAQETATDSAKILQCQNAGRACKADGGTDCYSVYDACMRDGGMR